jgi:hypothetical protein
VSTSDITRLEDDHGRIWKESAVAYFKTLMQYLPEGERVGDLKARVDGTAVLRSRREATGCFSGVWAGQMKCKNPGKILL